MTLDPRPLAADSRGVRLSTLIGLSCLVLVGCGAPKPIAGQENCPVGEPPAPALYNQFGGSAKTTAILACRPGTRFPVLLVYPGDAKLGPSVAWIGERGLGGYGPPAGLGATSITSLVRGGSSGLVVGSAPVDTDAVRVTYTSPDGTRHEIDAVLGRATAELVDRLGGGQPFTAFTAQLPKGSDPGDLVSYRAGKETGRVAY